MDKTLHTPYLNEAKSLLSDVKKYKQPYWTERGEAAALKLFHEAATRIPAYKDFLEKQGFDPDSVVTIEDFQKVPLTSKDNYLRKYKRSELCWDGNFTNNSWTISATSGSTGKPFYFPRQDVHNDYYALTAEMYLLEHFKIDQKSTLYVDAFAMGVWIGGVFTYESVRKVAERGYDISVVTPGINTDEVLNCVRELGGEFDQVIIGCYPPILKDIVDIGVEQGIEWSDYNLGIVFSAEGFSESFRQYIFDKANLKDSYLSTLNHYGTVDMGTMSHETALTNLIRKNLADSDELSRSIFGKTKKLPTLTQFLPEQFYFEQVDGNVVCTSNSGYPLIRYDLKDIGGVLTMEEVEVAYRESGASLRDEASRAHIDGHIWNLPFVYLFERADFSVTFSGAQIYPEEVKKALLNPELHDSVTGKLTLISDYDEEARNYLEVHIELRRGVDASKDLENLVQEKVVEILIAENSEYRVLHQANPDKLLPNIKLWPFKHEEHFSGKGKQVWSKKRQR